MSRMRNEESGDKDLRSLREQETTSHGRSSRPNGSGIGRGSDRNVNLGEADIGVTPNLETFRRYAQAANSPKG